MGISGHGLGAAHYHSVFAYCSRLATTNGRTRCAQFRCRWNRKRKRRPRACDAQFREAGERRSEIEFESARSVVYHFACRGSLPPPVVIHVLTIPKEGLGSFIEDSARAVIKRAGTPLETPERLSVWPARKSTSPVSARPLLALSTPVRLSEPLLQANWPPSVSVPAPLSVPPTKLSWSAARASLRVTVPPAIGTLLVETGKLGFDDQFAALRLVARPWPSNDLGEHAAGPNRQGPGQHDLANTGTVGGNDHGARGKAESGPLAKLLHLRSSTPR